MASGSSSAFSPKSSAPRPQAALTQKPKRWPSALPPKEAFSKAVGTGFKAGVFMRDIGVVNARSGAPTLALTGGAAQRLAVMTPEGHRISVHLTLTDDHPWAQAFVILEALPL